MIALIPKTLILPTKTLFLYVSPLRRFHSPSTSFSATAGEDPYRRRAEPPRRNYEEENRSVKVTVWWDFENCQVPAGVHVERVANRIASALRYAGIKGPVTITAFGDVVQMSRATQEALTSTGVCLNHVPHRSFVNGFIKQRGFKGSEEGMLLSTSNRIVKVYHSKQSWEVLLGLFKLDG